MPEQSSTRRERRSLHPLLLLIILLLLLLLGFALSNWFVNQCLAKLTPPVEENTQAQVLGVTNLDVTGDLNQVQGGGVVNFTVTGDHDEPLENALIVFDTTGQGTIQSAPVGSGLCIKVSDTQATCTGVNLLSNQAINYVVPVVVDTTCGLLGTDRVGLNVTVSDNDIEDANATGDVGCVSTAATSTSSTGATSSTSGTSSSMTSTPAGSTTTTSDVDVSGGGEVTTQDYAAQVAACYTNGNNILLAAVGIPLILLLVIYAIASMGNRRDEDGR